MRIRWLERFLNWDKLAALEKERDELKKQISDAKRAFVVFKQRTQALIDSTEELTECATGLMIEKERLEVENEQLKSALAIKAQENRGGLQQ